MPHRGHLLRSAQRIARAALRGYVFRPVGLAVNYHTTAIRPYWAPSLVRQTVIGAHIFYLRPDSENVEAFWQAPAGVEPAGGIRYAGVGAVAREPSVRVTRGSDRYEAARVETATVERPTMQRVAYERAVVERPPGFGPPARNARRAVRSQAQSRAPATAPQRGPRTTIENGVHVSRGS